MIFRPYAVAITACSLVMAAACGTPQADTGSDAPEEISKQIQTSGAGGSATDEVEPASGVPAALVDAWVLVAIDGGPVTESLKRPTLEIFDDGTVAGVGGINRFNTQLELTDGHLTFGPIAATKMAGPPEIMDLETTYLGLLADVSSYKVVGDTLELTTGGDQTLTFTRGAGKP